MSAMKIAEFDALLEATDHSCDVWGMKDEDVRSMDPYDDVLITVWDEDERVVFEDIVDACKVRETLDYLAVLIGGGLL